MINPVGDPAVWFILRGGSWISIFPQRLRGACRDYGHPGGDDSSRGFRVAVAS